MDKRGEGSDLLWNVIMALLIVTAAASMFIWVSNASSGKLIESQIDAKESSLIVDLMRPGTELVINKSLILKKNELVSEFEGGPYSYSIFNPKVSLQKVANGTEVRS